MKKFSVLAVTALLLLTFAACSGGGSDDYGLNDWTKALKEYNGKLEKVDSAEDYAKAIEAYAKDLKKIEGRLEKLVEDYPELFSGTADQELPKGISENDLKTFGEEFGKSMQMSFSMMKYSEDEKVKKVLEEYDDVMDFLE
jgi:hypothetical protein